MDEGEKRFIQRHTNMKFQNIEAKKSLSFTEKKNMFENTEEDIAGDFSQWQSYTLEYTGKYFQSTGKIMGLYT